MIKIAIVVCLAALAAAEADADAWYQPYGYSNWNMYSNWPMNYNNWNMYSNSWNRPSYTQYRTFYHKRSADAEADADAWYQPYGYGYSNWGYNGHNTMSYWNRPYSQYSFYRYHHY